MDLKPGLVFGALLALCACFEEADYEETRMRGDLGRGTFVYGCLNDSDTSCDQGSEALPKALAVGSRFDVRFSIASGAQPSVVSPATDLVRRVGDAFEVRSAGEFALLAVNANREVIDLKHLRGAEVEEIRVQQGRALPAATVALSPRQSVELLALPFGADGVKLGGALDYTWRSSDEGVLAIESLPGLNRVRVRAGSGSGRALLGVEVAGATYEVVVQVGSGGGAADAGTDSGELDAGDAEQTADASDPDAAAVPDATSDAAEPDAGTDTNDAGGDA